MMGIFDLENFPTSESAKRQLSYVTEGFYEKSYVGKWLYQVMGLEYDDARVIFEELKRQFFPETATWGLMYHEIKYQLPVREELSYEERRRLIYQKRDYRLPITPYHLERYLSNALGFEVHIADCHDPGEFGYKYTHPNRFEAVFIGDGTLDTKKVRGLLDKLKQSHTVYTINERILIIIDNRDSGWFRFLDVRIHGQMFFWGCPVFDGSRRFDGSMDFGARRRYDLVPGVKYLLEGGMATYECVAFKNVAIRTRIQSEELPAGCWGSAVRLTVNFWRTALFDGTRRFDGKRRMDAGRQALTGSVKFKMKMEGRRETVGRVTVTIRKNPCFFDGLAKMNGSRLFNSVNRKEEL